MARKILVNALHTQTGGGLIYLNHILPFLAKEANFDVVVLCQKKYKNRIDLPENVMVEAVNLPKNFFYIHFWEQCMLPFKARKMGTELTFNIANYAPIFAPKPVVFLTNNPEVRYTAPLKYRPYWFVLIWLTRLSVWVSPLSLSNGNYIQKVYLSGLFKTLQKKVRSAPSACDETGLKSKKPLKNQLIAVGDFYTHKDYPTLIHMVVELKKTLKNIKLIIVGRFVHDEVETKLKATIKRLGLTENVVLKGVLKHKEVIDLYYKSAVYVSASDAEAYPLTLLEALQTNTPAVVKNHAFNREVAGENGAVYVPVHEDFKENGKAFAKEVAALLADDVTYKKLQKFGAAAAKKSSWKRTGAVVVQALKDVLR